MTRIDIDYPVEKIGENAKRMQACVPGKKYYERVPVSICLAPRFFASYFGIEYKEIFNDAKTQLDFLLQSAKFQCENLESDMQTTTTLYIHPWFDGKSVTSCFGAEVVFPDNDTLRSRPILHNLDDAVNMELPSPENGLTGKSIRWWLEMKELIKDVEIYWNGVRGNVEMAPLGLQFLGPHNLAVDLAGEDVFWWMLEEPERYHRLLCKITKGMMIIEDFCRAVDPRPRGHAGFGEDAAHLMSSSDFIKHVAPYNLMYYGRYTDLVSGTRWMHMCGDSTHLLDALVDVLKINQFLLFGYMVDPVKVAEVMGGKVYMTGNVNPMMMLTANPEAIKEECYRIMGALAPHGGAVLCDGANICPGTPLENINALTEASKQFALDNPGMFSTIVQ